MTRYDSDFFRELPKIDLHRHLDGDVRPEVLLDLAEEQRVDLPYDTPEELAGYFEELRDEGFGALLQKGFGMVTALMQSRWSLEKVAYEEVANLDEENIVYAEIRFAPQYHTGMSEYYGHADEVVGEELTYDEIIGAVARGLERGEEDFGVKTNIIVCIGREAEPDVGVEVAQAALRNQDRGVVALDLACDEASFPPERHVPGYEETFGSNLNRTVHAGENGIAPGEEFESEEAVGERDREVLRENMRTAMEELRAHRLGHARTIAQEEDVLEAVLEQEVGLEMCPESNVFCGYIESTAELEIPELLERGALVSVNTDDPAMFGYSLSDSFELLYAENELDTDAFWQLQENAVRSAFLPEEEKEEILALFESFSER